MLTTLSVLDASPQNHTEIFYHKIKYVARIPTEFPFSSQNKRIKQKICIKISMAADQNRKGIKNNF
jgi:hypothetical protein